MWEKIRRFGVEVYCFLTAPFVVKNCLGVLGLFGSVFLFTFWWLKCYTNHGESVQVPNYVGMNIREASRKAIGRNFHVVIEDSLYRSGKAPGEVLLQEPAAQSHVKEGRTIYFTIAKNNPDIVRMPSLVGSEDYDLYARKCTALGLFPRVTARVADPKRGPNFIIAVIYRGDTITDQIARGYKVEMDAAIDFVVSEKELSIVTIPDCVCLTYDAAKFLLTTSNLSVGSVFKDSNVTDEENAYVWRQSPAAIDGNTIHVGEQIDLYLTQEEPAGCKN